MADNKIILTKEGLEKLEAEFRHLVDVETPEVIEELSLARSQGDLSENADFDAARNRQAQIERRIQEIENIKATAVIVDTEWMDANTIGLGSVFSYVEVEGDKEVSEVYTAKLVGSVESNPFADPIPLISIDSPLARAVNGLTEGANTRVDVDVPYHIVIKSVENASKAKKSSKKK